MKKFILTTVQAGITILLLWWIFRDAEKRAMMWETLQTADWPWFIPGFLAVGLAALLQSIRWKWLLGVQGIHPGLGRTHVMNLIGMFFNLFLPGGTGGDLIKMYYAGREARGKKAAAVLSVFMDRVVGLLALILLAGIAGVLTFQELWASPELRPLLLTLAAVVGGSIGFILTACAVEVFHLSGRIPHWIPFRHGILEMATAFSTYAKSGSALIGALLISLPSHLLFFFSFYCAARALTDSLSFLQMLAVLPLILTISALPVSVAGLGVREQLFRVCLGVLYGTPSAVAVLAGFSGFLLTVAWGAIGGILYIFYRSSEPVKTSLSRMTHEMEEIEETLEATDK